MASMRTLAVVAYPDFSDADREWVESVRTAYDPQARKVAAHFTLVFPAAVEEGPMLGAALAAAAHTGGPIPFRLEIAEAAQDPVGGDSRVFLFPGEGDPQLRELHQRLHAGALRHLLDPARPFSPHITVAAEAWETCDRLARKWEQERLPIEGVVRAIEVIEVLPDSVWSITSFPLTAGAGG
jgi:2'-5' RNA ligase